jgi:lysophospholipase L1-like esterase
MTQKTLLMTKHIIFIIILLFVASTYNAQPIKKAVRDSLRYKSNIVYSQQLALYDLYKLRQADIVMLGNSLTHGAAWNELLGRTNVVERGIPGDGLDGYMDRMNYVYKLNPKIVFIMGGLNDIYNWVPVEELFSIYVRIVENLKAKNIIPVIQSTTYAAKEYGKDFGLKPESNFGRNREIDKLNKLLSDYAKKNNIDYVDLVSQISTKDGYLRPELAIDGIHFKPEAFRIWAREVEKVLLKHKL